VSGRSCRGGTIAGTPCTVDADCPGAGGRCADVNPDQVHHHRVRAGVVRHVPRRFRAGTECELTGGYPPGAGTDCPEGTCDPAPNCIRDPSYDEPNNPLIECNIASGGAALDLTATAICGSSWCKSSTSRRGRSRRSTPTTSSPPPIRSTPPPNPGRCVHRTPATCATTATVRRARTADTTTANHVCVLLSPGSCLTSAQLTGSDAGQSDECAAANDDTYCDKPDSPPSSRPPTAITDGVTDPVDNCPFVPNARSGRRRPRWRRRRVRRADGAATGSRSRASSATTATARAATAARPIAR